MSARQDPFSALFAGISSGEENLSRSEFAERYFLNPQVPIGIQDDPDGSFHFNLGVATPEGDPYLGPDGRGIKKDQPIPLRLRWYQREMLNDGGRFRVYRMGRRTGKSFVLGVEAVVEALTNPNARVLVLAPNESHVKVLFDEYIRPLLKTYRHKKSGRIGIPNEIGGRVPLDCDYIIQRDTQKPQEITITDGKHHNVTIRGMVISNSARGQSANVLVFDEADYADTEAVRGIVLPIINTRKSTRIVMSSTPTGRRDSFYYEACNDSMWNQHHHTFEVLPHYDEEMRARTAKLAGGETSNTFIQEYLADFGTQVSGVFDQKALNKAFFISPYARVLERIDPRTKERIPQLAGTKTDHKSDRMAFYEAVQPVDWPLPQTANALGSESIYRPEYRGHGVVCAGTDWNSVAGMQTVITWFPPESWLKEGRLKVSRFDYNGTEPVTTSRAKDKLGGVREFTIGHDNGDPGGKHDLTQIKGIVIWHGRLEGGHFNWLSAANRVAGIMSIPDFVDAWYVDFGYGEQVNEMIQGIMASGQFLPDDNLLSQAETIDDRLMRQIRLFHPEQDIERTGKVYRTIQFAKPYSPGTDSSKPGFHDIDFKKRGDLYKDVMVGLARKMISARELLIPYGEFVGFHKDENLGNYYTTQIDPETGDTYEVTESETDKDMIDPTGARTSESDTDFGGLITQMREWRVEGYSPTGRPRYSGHDHAIDGFMLSLLAYYENFSEEGPGNMFRRALNLNTEEAGELFEAVDEINKRHRKPKKAKGRSQSGDFSHPNYSNERDALDAIRQGADPAQVGTPLETMWRMALNHFDRTRE